MGWFAVFLIGLALGWALEFLVDVWFWGRRHRNLESRLGACRSDFHASENKVEEIQTIVTQYQAKEDQYQKCEIDLADRAVKQDQMETLTEDMSKEIHASQKQVDQLNAQVAQLKEERDHLRLVLEEVDQWVESSMRRRIWDAAPWQQAFSRSRKRTVGYARSIAATATSKMGLAAGKLSGHASAAKKKMGQKIDPAWPMRLLRRGHCTMWALIGMVYKKAAMPQSCSIDRK